MKNFFKKLSFVLAIAMVLTSLAPATASAAAKNYVAVNGKKATATYAYIGGKEVVLTPYVNGKKATKVTIENSNPEKATIDNNGVITPVANGNTIVTFKKGDKKIGTVTVKVRTRAKALNIYDRAEYKAGNKTKLTELTLKVGDKKDLQITMPLYKVSKKAGAVKASYFTYPEVSDSSVVKVTKNAGQRNFTVEALAAGTAKVTIVANQKSEKNVRSDKYYKEASFTVEVTGEQKMSVKATHANVLEATVASPVDAASASAVVVKRGTTTINATAKISGTKIEITTDAKMIKGEYTVTLGDLSASCEVEDQYVAEITILGENDYVATNASGTWIYVYYDVLDQYKDSVRKSATVNWTHSLQDKDDTNKEDGLLILKKTDNVALTYGSSVFITGVYNKGTNVVTKSAEVKVGLPQKVGEVEIKGVVKKNTNKFTTLPANFQDGTYFLAYTIKDQYNNPMDPTNSQEVITFTSKAPLVATINKDAGHRMNVTGTVVIDDVTYALVEIQRGNFTSKGGNAEIQAISGQTGLGGVYTLEVLADQILTSFKLGTPSDIVSEGRTVEIPFTALDQNGEEIKSYRVLNGNVTFNCGNGSLKMKEQNDGTAKLYYTAPADRVSGGATEEIDLYETITSVVVGGTGSVDTQQFYVKDKAHPAAISAVAGNPAALLEGDSTTIYANYTDAHWYAPYFVYVDQYGRKLDKDDPTQNGEINAWLTASANYVAFEYTGSNRISVAAAGGSGADQAITVSAATSSSIDTVNEVVTFELKSVVNRVADQVVPGSAKKVQYSAVDLSKIVSFTATGVGELEHYDPSNSIDIYVSGKLADGTSVNVPREYESGAAYWTITASAVTGYTARPAHLNLSTPGAVNFTSTALASVDGITPWVDQYSAGNPYRNEKLNVVVLVHDVNNNGTQKDVVTVPMTLSNKAPYAAKVVEGYGVKDGKAIINATNGAITAATLTSGKFVRDYDTILDQYGDAFAGSLTVTVSKVVEKADGVYTTENPISVQSNAGSTTNLIRAEIGDTFVVEYRCGGAALTVEMTVGADQTAFFGTTSPNASTLY